MQYRVVYDIQQAIYPAWWVTLVGLIFISIGALVFYVMYGTSELKEKLLSIGFILFGILWVAIGLLSYSEMEKVRAAVRAGNYQVVEGVVRDFAPMPYGHGKESFSLNSQSFSYSDFVLAPGFSQSKSHGGPIREGLQVRVSYIGESIVKLEVDE